MVTIGLIVLQVFVVSAIYGGETPLDWGLNDSIGANSIFAWLFLIHSLFVAGVATSSVNTLAIYSAALASVSVYGLATSLSGILDVFVMIRSIPIFLCTNEVANLLGPRCMHSLNRLDST